jgi:hypothetical protein
VPPLHSSMVLPPGTRRGFRLTACWMRITLQIRNVREFAGYVVSGAHAF